MKKYFLFLPIALLFLVGANSCGPVETADDIKLRVAVFGDNRIGYEEWLKTKDANPSSANLPQLDQNLKDISQAEPKADLVVFLGDMVMNQVQDNGETLKIQLDAWQEHYQSLSVAGDMNLLPVPGNHELNFYDTDTGTEAPNPGAIDAWLAWFKQNSYDKYAGNGPTPTGDNPDDLVRDESDLTYSFNIGDVHFLIINTDTLNTKTDAKTGLVMERWIPINWVKDDLEKAQADPAISAIIVMGHRPARSETRTAEYAETAILDTPAHPFDKMLMEAMKENDKVRAYIASHLHTWSASRLEKGKGTWQVVSGNAGAELDGDWHPQGGPYFGYCLLDIYQDGKVVLRSYGRPLPPDSQKIYEDTPVAPEPATLRQEIILNE
ncbi:metallophosphoesterase [Patescibacteria group bacterium]|nr:metallophosphoesterase [Patescibacteria group bacterium]MBU1674039.1 metallophosphoesterase [Patescibacteria group bacterium]MBU1963187.1 metallophosphoesterase [Patescibacteria group bacterium]